MSSDDKQNDWSQDPSLSGIDFARLQALQQMASQSRGKSQAEMMPFLLSLMQGKTLPVWNPKPVSVFILCFFLPSSAWKARFYFLPGNQSEKQRSESVQPRSARYSARKVPECRRSEE